MTINTNNTTAACSGSELADELERDYPAVDVTTVLFSSGFAGVGCCVIPQDRVLSIIAALRAQASAPRSASAGARMDDAFGDLKSHRASWRRALELARDYGPTRINEVDDRSYWEHELRAFDRTFTALASNPLEGKGVQSTTEQADFGLRSPDSGNR